MRLLRLKVGRLGVLRNREWSFPARVTVLTAENEAGKTTFLDALLCALFGVPQRRGRAGPEQREFDARYEGVVQGLEAELKPALGEPFVSAAEAPKGSRLADNEIVRNLLVLRSGECPLEPDSGFADRFANRVLGLGAADVEGAIAAVSRVAKPPQSRSAWEATPQKWRSDIQEIKTRLERVDKLEEAQRKLADFERDLAAKKADVAGADEDFRHLSAAMAAARRDRLARLRAELVEADDKLRRLAAPSRSELGALQTKHRAVGEAEEARRVALAALKKAEAELQLAERGTVEARDKIAGLATPKALSTLRQALEELQRREAARAAVAAAGGPPGWFPWAGAGLAAVAAGAVAWTMMHSGALPLALALAAGMAAFILLRLVSARRREARVEDVEGARRDFEARRDAMGGAWVGLPREQAKARIEDESSKGAAAQEIIEDRQQRLVDRSAALEAARHLLEAEERSVDMAREDLRAALQRFAAPTVEKATELAEERQRLEALVKDRLEATAQELGRSLGASEDPQVALRIAEEQLGRAADGLPEELRKIDPIRAVEQHCEADRRLAFARAELDRMEEQRRELEAVVNQLQGPEPVRAAELDAQRRRKELFLEEIERWRKAAIVAREELGKLKQGAEEIVRECAEWASTILPALTDGRYKALTIARGLHEENAIEVEHATLGRKPLSWLSRGAQDSVWLAMRLAMARRGFEEPAFVVLDEPFVHLDPCRAERAMTALVSEENLPGWQILILTKDSRVAETLGQAGMVPPEGRICL